MKTNAKMMSSLILMGSLIAPTIHAQTVPTPSNSPDVAALSPAPPMDLPGHPDDRPRGPRHHLDRQQGDRKMGDRRAGGRREGLRNRGDRGGLTALTTLTGTVGELKGNDDFILDGFTLKTASGSTTIVKFPAHLGQSVQQAIKSGSSVSVSGIAETSPSGENRFRMTSLTAGKNTVMDAPPVMRQNPPSPPTVSTLTGKVADYQFDREGRIKGLMLTTSGDSKTIVRIPADVAFQLSTLLSKGGTVTVQGYSKIPHEGQVQLEKVNILRPTVLTINGQQYLVR